MNIACRLAYRRAAQRSSRASATNIRKMTSTKPPPTVQETITWKLSDRFTPVHLDVINESYMHNVPKGTESHFKVIVISDTFKGMPLIKRHRLVNDTLADELSTGVVHALSITAKAPEQWDGSTVVEKSPPCRGGAGL